MPVVRRVAAPSAAPLAPSSSPAPLVHACTTYVVASRMRQKSTLASVAPSATVVAAVHSHPELLTSSSPSSSAPVLLRHRSATCALPSDALLSVTVPVAHRMQAEPVATSNDEIAPPSVSPLLPPSPSSPRPPPPPPPPPPPSPPLPSPSSPRPRAESSLSLWPAPSVASSASAGCLLPSSGVAAAVSSPQACCVKEAGAELGRADSAAQRASDPSAHGHRSRRRAGSAGVARSAAASMQTDPNLT